MGKYALQRWPERQTINGLLVFGTHAPHRTLAAGPLLRALRVRLLMTQRQLARRAGVPQPAIAQIERGRRDPGVRTLARLLDALFCDLILVPRPRKHVGDLLHEAAQARTACGEYFARPNPRMWKK